MKNKTTALQILSISIIVIFSCFLSGIFTSWNIFKGSSSSIEVVNTQASVQDAEVINGLNWYEDSYYTTAKNQYAYVVYFKHDTDVIDNSQLNDIISRMSSGLSVISEAIRDDSINTATMVYTPLYDADNNPLVLSIEDSTNSSTYASVYDLLTAKLNDNSLPLSGQMDRDNINLVFVYIGNLASYDSGNKTDLINNLNVSLTQYNHTYNAAFNTPETSSLQYCYKNGLSTLSGNVTVENFSIVHGDLLSAINAGGIDDTLYPYDVRNYARAVALRNTLTLFGMPLTSYIDDDGNSIYNYAGNWDITSNGPFYSKLNYFYYYSLQWANAPSVEYITNVGEQQINVSSNTIYIIEPTGSKYSEQAIIIQPFSSFTGIGHTWSWDSSKSAPNVDFGFTVARINTQLDTNGKYKNASSDFIPYYIFTPTSSDVDNTRSTNPTLNTSYISSYGTTSIGSVELKTPTDAYNTGYISLYNTNTNKYENSQLKITITGYDAGEGIATLKFECNNSEVLPPNVASNNLSSIDLDRDVAILLYNIYVDYNAWTILSDPNYSSLQLSDLFYTDQENDPNKSVEDNIADTWSDFYQGARKNIFDTITTLDSAFTYLQYLDLSENFTLPNFSDISLPGCRNVTDLTFLHNIPFLNLIGLSIRDQDLSHCGNSGHKSSLDNLVDLKSLKYLDLVNDKISDISLLSCIADTDDDYPTSTLEKISLLNNEIQDISVLNHFGKLQYANVAFNNISTEVLNTKYRNTNTTFFTNNNFDIGLQRMPTDVVYSTPKNPADPTSNTYVFKAWVNSNDVVANPNNVVLTYSSDFSEPSTEIAGQNTSSGGAVVIADRPLLHGRYKIADFVYYSLLDSKNTRTSITIPARYINCFFLKFTYDTEEVCQTENTSNYDCGIDAYNNLNALLNYDDNKFIETNHFVFPVNDDGSVTYTPIDGGLDLRNVGTYEVSYTFKLKDTFKTTLGILTDDSLVVAKRVIVYPYKKITCIADNDDDYNIKDSMLYKALLVLSGKQAVNVFTQAFNDSNLGVDSAFTLYSQDLYFYNVADVHTPSIKELRAEPDINQVVHIVSNLDISATAFSIYRKMHNLGVNDPVNTTEPLISTIKGLQFVNLGSIESLNLNSMGIDDDLLLLFTPGVLPSIKTLNLADNRITKINNINNLTTLEYLDLSFNQISDATYLRPLTDPVALNANGYTTQTLKRINLAFNLINLVDSSKNQQFMLGSTLPNGVPTTFKPFNQIYIILVQNLTDYNVYSKESKWNYFYTPAVYTSKTMSSVSKKMIYSIKITGNGVAGGTGNVQGETFEKKQSSNTGYSTLAGRYTIVLDFNSPNAKEDGLPFAKIEKSLHYTIVIPSVKDLYTSYASTFPNSLLLDANRTVEDNKITYYMLSTEYEDFLNNTLYAQYEAQWNDATKHSALINNSSCPAKFKEHLSKEVFLNYYSTEIDFVNALNNAGFVLGFKAYIPHVNLSYGTGATYWNTFYQISSAFWKNQTYNTNIINYSVLINTETITYTLPIKIECVCNDSSQNVDVNNRYIRLAYYVTFNRSNSFASEIAGDAFALKPAAQTDSFVYFIDIKIVNNPEVGFKDSNLERALKIIVGKTSNDQTLYSYDFYNTAELNLSNYGITSFDKKEDAAYGFDSFVFSNLQKIDLSGNKLENQATLSTFDPLNRLFSNQTIFCLTPIQINGKQFEFKLVYLDLSYNNLKYITSIGAGCFSFPTLTVNLFGNNIDFFENVNVNYIKNSLPADADHAKVIVGIQGLKNGTTTLISYKENIESYDDENSRARFFFYHGNTMPTSGYYFERPGLESNSYITYDDTENTNPLFTTFYYTDTYYQINKNYSVSYRANYSLSNGQDIAINFNTTVIHQKLYIKAEYNEFGTIISSDGILYEDFKSDTLDPAAYNEYIQSILDKDVFTYENCSPADFVKTSGSDSYPYTIRIGLVETTLHANALTSVPYEQHYIIQHSSPSKPKEFVKYINIVDKTCPIIKTTSDTSKDKYIITRGKVYDNYVSSQNIDSDIAVYDEYDIYFNRVANLNVKIYKDDILLSDTDAQINATENNLGINVTEVGVYKIVYTAIDSNGNISEPYTRIIEIYYQPYAWIKLTDFSASFTAGNVTISAMVYRPEEDINKNTDPTFYWYLDGELVGTSKKIEDQSNETNYYSEIPIFVQGAGNHNIEVYIDITREAFMENSELAGFESNGLALSTKATQVFILLDDNVIKYSSIALGVFVVLIIILIIALRVRKRNKENMRNTYEYNIEKHNRRK